MRWSQWRKWSVATVRFRRLDGGNPKYMTVPGDKPRLYNTHALTRYSKDMAITEGELDAVTAELAGIPTVGVPGAQMWKPYFRELFLGYRNVNILADGDEAGMEFARQVAKSLHNSRIIPMPDGEDVNSLVLSQGKDALLERIA
jgi:DNA primase